MKDENKKKEKKGKVKGKGGGKKNKPFPIFNALREEIKTYITERFIPFVSDMITKRENDIRKAIFIFVIFFSLMITGFIGLSIYFYIEYRPLISSIINAGYTYKFKRKIFAKLAGPVRIKLPIEQQVTLPFKQIFRARVPFKTTFSIPVNQTFSLPIKEPISIYINHKFPIKEKVHINTTFPIDTTATVSLFGIDKDVKVKGNFPLNVKVPIDHKFHFDERISFKMTEPINVPIDQTFDIPIDVIVDAKFPIDMEITVPLKLYFDTDINIDQKIPVLIEFDMIFSPLKGIEVIQKDERDEKSVIFDIKRK